MSSGQLTDARVECSVERGMAFTAVSDQKTHIAVTYSIYFNLSDPVSYPLEFNIRTQPKSTDASLAQHAELHPIDVTAYSSESNEFYYSPWWVSEGELSITLEEVVKEQPGIATKVIEGFIDNPILFAPVILLLAGAVVLLMRTKNAIDLELDLDVEDEVESGTISDDETDYEEEDDEVQKTEEGYSEEHDITADGLREQSADKPVKARRKAVQKVAPKDGPITKVKRRRLDSIAATSEELPRRKTASKKKVVRDAPTQRKVKTRKVVTYSDKNDEDADED